MRKQSDTVPQPYEIGEVREDKRIVYLRENVRYLSENEIEYDEYTISLPSNLEIEENLRLNTRAWIAYARRMETKPNSSALWHLNKQHNEELADTTEIFVNFAEKTIGGSYSADRRYEPGEYLIAGGTMYKVLLPIMPGAFLTPGTNIEETTIQAEIAKMNKEEP